MFCLYHFYLPCWRPLVLMAHVVLVLLVLVLLAVGLGNEEQLEAALRPVLFRRFACHCKETFLHHRAGPIQHSTMPQDAQKPEIVYLINTVDQVWLGWEKVHWSTVSGEQTREMGDSRLMRAWVLVEHGQLHAMGICYSLFYTLTSKQ